MTGLDALDRALLDRYQRDLPLISTPYAALAEVLEVDEASVLSALCRLREKGAISRVGPVFSPRRIGASTLAALAVPPVRLREVAERVSARAEVNHNYGREHRYNLWFVATAESEVALQRALDELEADAGAPMLRLPLVEEFHIDLAFGLSGRSATAPEAPRRPPAAPRDLGDAERRLLAEMQHGLPLVSRPFAEIGARAGCDEATALAQLQRWLADGAVKRCGLVVRHHEFGYTANAMVVWDVAEDAVSAVGQKLAAEAAVTLCYRRPRVLPDWPYNLFCMIHGRERGEVEAEIAKLVERHALASVPHAVLFSSERFKQCGAQYVHGRKAAT